MNHRAAALSGLSWSMSSQILRMLLQIATTIILARLLTPGDFGVFAMVLPVISLANLLQDFGLHQSLMQKSEITNDQVNQIFWINFVITLVIAAMLAVASPFIADFYSDARLTPMLAGWSGVLLLSALSFGQYAMLARAFRYKTLAIIDMLCAVAGFITVIVVAWTWRTYWALWLSGFTSVVCWVAMTYAVGTWRPGLPRRGVKLEGMFSFGVNIMFHNIANYASRNTDAILIGKSLGGVALGFYDRAYKLLLYPLENLANPAARVMLPILSRLQNDDEGYRRAFLQANGLLNLISIPGMAVAIACSAEVVRILLGDKWAPVSGIFFWLGFAGLLQPFVSAAGWLLMSQGRSHDLMRVSVAASVATVAAFLIGLKGGVEGVAMGLAISEMLVRIPLLCIVAGRRGPIGPLHLIMSFAPLLVGCAFVLIVTPWLRDLGLHGWKLILASLPLSYLLGAGALAVFPSGRSTLLAALRLAEGVRGRIPRRQ